MRRRFDVGIVILVALALLAGCAFHKQLRERDFREALRMLKEPTEACMPEEPCFVAGFSYRGYLITAKHCQVAFDTVLYADLENDVALVRTDGDAGLIAAKQLPGFGEPVVYFVISPPRRYAVTGTFVGPVDRDDPEAAFRGTYRFRGATWRGASGSPVLNLRGELIGLVSGCVPLIAQAGIFPFHLFNPACAYLYFVPVAEIDAAIDRYEMLAGR